jgi:hypothetical protein
MRNITVTVSDKAYREARVWAAERDSSLSRIVAYLIQTLPNIRRAVIAFPVAKTAVIRPETTPNDAFSTPKNSTLDEKSRPLSGHSEGKDSVQVSETKAPNSETAASFPEEISISRL